MTERVSNHLGSQIYQARKEGYCIETRKVNDNNNKYEYRIAKEKTSIENLHQLVQNNLQAISHIKLLILFGSRISGNVHAKSDWDFAVIYCLKVESKQHHEFYPCLLLPSLLRKIIRNKVFSSQI